MVKILEREEVSYQELRPKMAKCSPIPPDFFAIDSTFGDFSCAHWLAVAVIGSTLTKTAESAGLTGEMDDFTLAQTGGRGAF
jgi:hypothetical protein